MLIRHSPDLPASRPRRGRYTLSRRSVLAGAAGALGAGALTGQAFAAPLNARPSPLLDRREADEPRGCDELQQLLRVRGRQGQSVPKGRQPHDEAVDREDRRPRQQARRLRPGGHRQTGAARGAHLPDALRRRLVDGLSIGSAFRSPRSSSARTRSAPRNTSRSRRSCGPRRCRGRAASCRCWNGPTWRACVSTRPCTRSRFWPSASTAKRSRTRTARRCGSWCRGSTGSRHQVDRPDQPG